MIIRCKMINCSNSESVGIRELNNNGFLLVDENCFEFNNIKSSRIKAILFKEEEIIIQTKNTKYTFEKVR